MAVGDALSTQAGMARRIAPRAPISFTSTTVAEHWDGTSWQIVPTPNPPGATFSSLNDVSCPRPRICFAVGDYGANPNSPFASPLIERWDGTSWSIQPSEDVGNGALGAVSCSGPLACTAVGGLGASASGGELALRWDGTGWHVQSTPHVEDSPRESQLTDVSCPRRRTCTAVGWSITFDGSGLSSSSPLVERWFGRINAWGLQAAPKPAAAEAAGLSGVSCPDGPVCFAVGWFGIPSIPRIGIGTLAERRVGSSWSVMPTPNPTQPPGSGVNAQLSGVSCPRRRACHAVGTGVGSAGDFIAIAERFDGASWQLESIPTNGLEVPTLRDVSCPSRLFCMAVGGSGGFSGGTVAAKWTP
jgi:hypothetical protein